MESLLGDLLCISVTAFLFIVAVSLTIAAHLRKKKVSQRPQFLLITLGLADLFVGCATTLVCTYVIAEYAA